MSGRSPPGQPRAPQGCWGAAPDLGRLARNRAPQGCAGWGWERETMDRRNFLKASAVAGGAAMFGGMPAPALSQGAAAHTLRFVPQANLANFDPIWGTQYVVRNAAV